MEICFYPYDFQYRVQDDVVQVYLYARQDSGEQICVVYKHQPSFFASLLNIDEKEFEKRLSTLKMDGPRPAKVISFEKVEKELLGKKREFYQIYANYPKAVPVLAREIQSWGVPCFEKDILFIHRFLRDLKILPMTLVKAEGEFRESSQRVKTFFADTLKQEDTAPGKHWKVLALDIETYAHRKEIDAVRNPVLMVALYGENGDGTPFRKVITWKETGKNLEYEEVVADEKALIERLSGIIKEYSPDIITGYFTDGFDFPYLNTRAQKYKLSLDWGLDNSTLFVRSGAGFRDTECKIAGMLHLDLLKFVKYIFGKNLKTDSYSLGAVSQELLGITKHDVNLDELSTAWDQHDKKKLLAFCEYNLQDAHLTFKMCQKLLSDMIEFTKIVGVPTYDVIRMRFSRLVENYILKRAMEHDVLAPNKPDDQELGERMNESIEGAFVYEPTPGLYQDLVVFDFRSLYPTIIVSHNLGPESFKAEGKDKVTVPGKEEYWFSTEKAFIPSVLADLITYRMEIKNEIKKEKKQGNDTSFLEARSYAYKILANSFYGYLGFYGARWYCLECAASTTAYARHYIKKTIEKAEQTGFKVVYGDTDSCFFLLGEKKLQDALKFMDDVNKDLPGMMELEFEGHFPRGIFVAIKGTEKGAKKKYALVREDGSMKITGFETVRRNWSLLAKELQEEVLHLVLSDKVEKAVEYVKKTIEELQSGKIPLEKLIIKTQLTRELSKYASIGPHVSVARRMAEKGEPVHVGMVVEYVIVKGKGLVRERAMMLEEVSEGQYDSEYYLNHQLLPAVSSIFTVLGYSEDSLLGKAEQTGLGAYF
ncbi:hypothetical protein COV20_01995 [Candidatus Woesearchaeota archaeon CG10_big_fil_rev_8_21_14_0_10_45_16]|nr:MAG: hypothetical protein COV20_01995 [Candidatus Woesearchaeota archaeon CG10_big_fil_rev_8_21_14_0_10_45_16]